MYGQNRNSGIYRMQTYAQALEWFNNTLPIRGRGVNAGVKPLGHRDRPHFQMLKGNNNEIICRCYQTDVVIYMPDGAIKLNSGGYTSQTTAAFISDVLGVRAGIKDHDIVVSVYGNKSYRIRSGLELRYIDNRYVATTFEKVYSHTVNRKVMNGLRKEVAPFVKYMKGSIKLRGTDGFSDAEKVLTHKTLGYNELDLNPFGHWREAKSITLAKVFRFLDMAKGDDVGNWHLASCWLAWSRFPWGQTARISEGAIVDYMNELLIATNRDALIKTELPEGVVKVDRYVRLTKLLEAE